MGGQAQVVEPSTTPQPILFADFGGKRVRIRKTVLKAASLSSRGQCYLKMGQQEKHISTFPLISNRNTSMFLEYE